MPRHDFSLEGGLDLDFTLLRDADHINKIEELERLVEQYRIISPIYIAITFYICEEKALYKQAYPEKPLGDSELKEKYFTERLPKICSLDRRTISEYRIAGKFIYHNKEAIEQQGDLYQDGLLKKVYLASLAVDHGRPVEECIANIFILTREQFNRYAHGEDIHQDELSARPKSKFEGFVKEYERLRLFFDF
jgi:hypothetical protein